MRSHLGRMIGGISLAFMLSAHASDGMPDHELQYQVMQFRLKSMEKERKAREAALREDFERRYNRLAKAVSDFSSEYNANRGEVWPANKARELSRAMESMQKHIQFRPDEQTQSRR